jgi:hypothetical protein
VIAFAQEGEAGLDRGDGRIGNGPVEDAAGDAGSFQAALQRFHAALSDQEGIRHDQWAGQAQRGQHIGQLARCAAADAQDAGSAMLAMLMKSSPCRRFHGPGFRRI